MSKLSYSTHTSAPDSENIVKTQGAVKAQPFGTYSRPTALGIPEVPTDNALSQLGNALSKFNPALADAASQYKTELNSEEKAAAEQLATKTQEKNVTDLKQAQAQGLIPDGASPNYLRAFQSNMLKLNAERGTKLMTEAYYSNDELRNSDDPRAFDKFAAEWKGQYDEINHVSDAYTVLEVRDSQYHERVSSAIQQLHGQHITYRVGEREKHAVATAGDLVQTRLDSAFDQAVDAPDLTKVAQSINDVFANPATGMMSYGGMRGSQANEVLTESIIAKAVSAGDASILDVADHVQGRDGGSLAKTKVFREKAEVARQHIAQSKWMADEHDRTLARYRGDGTETLEQVQDRAREDRARIEQEHETAKEHRMQYAEGRTKQKAAEGELHSIAKLHSLNGDTSSVEMQQHLKALALADPEAYRSTVTWLQSSGRQANEHGNLQVFTSLRAELSGDPANFDTKKIVQAAAANQLTAGQVSSLFNESEQNQKAYREHPVLNAPLVRDLRSDLKAAVSRNEMDQFGEGRVRSDKAAFELNRLAMSYIKGHPKATEYELYEAMQPHVERLARKYNVDLDASLTGEERNAASKQDREQEISDMQSRVGKEVQELRGKPQADDEPRRGDSERTQLDAQLKAKGYKSAKQRSEIIDRLLRERKEGKK